MGDVTQLPAKSRLHAWGADIYAGVQPGRSDLRARGKGPRAEAYKRPVPVPGPLAPGSPCASCYGGDNHPGPHPVEDVFRSDSTQINSTKVRRENPRLVFAVRDRPLPMALALPYPQWKLLQNGLDVTDPNINWFWDAVACQYINIVASAHRLCPVTPSIRRPPKLRPLFRRTLALNAGRVAG